MVQLMTVVLEGVTKICKVGTDVSVCWVGLCVCVLIGASRSSWSWGQCSRVGALCHWGSRCVVLTQNLSCVGEGPYRIEPSWVRWGSSYRGCGSTIVHRSRCHR